MADETCRAFDSVGGLDKNSLNRFLVGVDPAPRKMTPAEVRTLGDVFASLLFAKGKIPRSGQQVIEGLKDGVPASDPLRKQKSFVLGEGSQLTTSAQTAAVARNLRFILTLGEGPDGPDVLMSVGSPRQPGGIEVMAWDRTVGGFNYYRSTGSEALWMFAGNSRDALRESSRGKGPFESHPSGALLMKELKTPWNNWHSPAANIAETVFARNDSRRTHEWFTQREPGGALTFELEAARPAMSRWASARFASLRKSGGTVARPGQIMEQILGTSNPRRSTVNLITTHIESGDLAPSSELDLPTTFFVDSDGLSEMLGLNPPPAFKLSGKIYANCLRKFDVRIEDGEGFRQKGDTHFCFLVPERAFEDQVVLREALEIGLLSKRLATCLLMVDPWNPVFSERRRALLRHVPATATIANGKSNFSRDMVNGILKTAETAPADTPEAEFAARWKVGARFAAEFNKMLGRYYDAVTTRLKTQAGFDACFRLAEERRQIFNEMPISEFPLLLPRTNIKRARRRMQPDGTVAEG